jgi:hypothetical protein
MHKRMRAFKSHRMVQFDEVLDCDIEEKKFDFTCPTHQQPFVVFDTVCNVPVCVVCVVSDHHGHKCMEIAAKRAEIMIQMEETKRHAIRQSDGVKASQEKLKVRHTSRNGLHC